MNARATRINVWWWSQRREKAQQEHRHRRAVVHKQFWRGPLFQDMSKSSLELLLPMTDFGNQPSVRPRSRCHGNFAFDVSWGYKKGFNGDSRIPEESKLVLAMLDQKPILKKQRAVLGFTHETQLKGIFDFINGSKAYQAGDYNAWFKSHWRMNDSWAIASMIVSMIFKLSLWPDYKFPPEFTGSDSLGYRVLRKMCQPNPFERYDAIQGLAELYPENTIITTYAGAWLKSATRHA